jgi:hypothetical protein
VREEKFGFCQFRRYAAMLFPVAFSIPAIWGPTYVAASTSDRAVQEYLVIDEVAIYNAATKFSEGFGNMATASTPAEAQADVLPFLSAVFTLRSEFKVEHWPLGAASGIRTAEKASTSLITHLRNAGEMTLPLSYQTWITKTGTLITRWVDDINLVNYQLGLPTIASASRVNACNADVAVVLVAIGAFRVQNPGIAPTRSLLLGNTDEGPFIKAWPDGAPFFTIRLNAVGQILVAAPPDDIPVRYGPEVCNAAF